jgi:hypothetical protein
VSTDSTNVTWTWFRRLGLVVLGLVIGALAVLAWGSWKTTVPEGGRRGYVITITHGPKDPDRVMLALFTATRLPQGDNHVWFSIDGGQLCKKGAAEKVSSPLFTKQGDAAKLIEQIRAKGIAVHI